MNFSLKLTTKL
jgi:hypothetical protein